MTNLQVKNFVYWLQEYSSLRGISDKQTPSEKMEHMELLIGLFFEKYPTGILTGWNRSSEEDTDNQYAMTE